MKKAHVAVVGAGWAGLAAAVELSRAGHRVTVLEAAHAVGGRARRVMQDGVALDNGQHILLGAYRECLRLIRLCGGDEAALMRRVPLQFTYPGLFSMRASPHLPAPLHLLHALMTAQGMTARDKWSAIRFMLMMQLKRFRVTPDISMSELLARHRQTEAAIKYLWAPLGIAALNTAPEEASAQVFLTVLRDAFTRTRQDSDLLIPQTDLSALFPDLAVNTLSAHHAEFIGGCAVDSLKPHGDGFSLASGTRAFEADQVILAVPPANAARLLPDSCATLTHTLNAIDYEPIITAYLQYPAGTRLPAPMMGLIAPISQWAFDKGQLGGSSGLIALVVSAARAQHSVARDDLPNVMHAELAATLPGLPEPLSARVIIEKRATFRCAPKLKRPGTATTLPGLWLAGDYVENGYPATLEGAVRSGVAAAQAVMAQSVSA